MVFRRQHLEVVAALFQNPGKLLGKRQGKKAPLVRNAPNTQLEGFAVCGKDKKWYWADKAVIDKDTVVVSSSKVPEPAAVRYAWQNNPNTNLYNKAGFPAAPFAAILIPQK